MMKVLLKIFGLTLMLALLVSGCTTLGPDYRKPEADVQTDWVAYEDVAAERHGLNAAKPVEPGWWRAAFKDPILDELVESALAQNLSLRSAGLRVLQARQRLAIAIGEQFPQQQQLDGQAGIERQNRNSYEIYDLRFNLNWEADVWGRFKRLIESESASLDANLAEYDGVRLSLVSEVARTYLLIRTSQQRLGVARYNLDLQQESVRITGAKFEEGEVSALDVEQAQTLLHNTEASLISLELSLQQLKNSLAVLLGKTPLEMGDLLRTAKPIPAIAPEIAIGMPQDLIRRRPDIRTAERQLAAQSAQIGFAITELYPHFGLGGSIGTTISTATDLSFGDLFTSKGFNFDLFGFFQWNIFNYGRLKNNVRLQDAVFQQLLEDYRQTVLQAQGEVENAIVAFLKSQQQLAALRLAANAAQRAADVSTTQYKEGEVNFNTVINTLQALASQQDQLASIQGTVATNLVEVCKSLGGGWEVREGQDTLDLIPEETREEMLKRTKYWNKTFKIE